MTQSPAPASKPILCRLNLHHQWHAEHNPMGEAYRRCLKCGKDDPGPPPRGTPKRPMPFG